MEFVIYLVIGIIYAIASASGYNGRYSRYNRRLNMEYGRYGLLGVDGDFSLEDSRLDGIRDEYDRRLSNYYKSNKPRTYLKNNSCELRLIVDKSGTYFYCKEKPNGNKKGRFFEVKGNSNHASTMWGVIDMEFNNKSDYASIKRLYYRLNQNFNTTGGLRYFYEPWLRKYPDYDERRAQNEYCLMELKELSSGKYIVLCTDLWSKKTKQFVIKGSKNLLLNILEKFSKEKNKFETYDDLLVKYVAWLDKNVKEIGFEELKRNSVQQRNEPKQEKEAEPIKYIHVDIEENKKNEEKNQNNVTENVDIKKYNERNLDL